MVKSGGESLEGGATALVHMEQPLTSPDWSFHSIAWPKTKRVGTPHPEKSRRALLRAGLEVSSVVSRAKKKMVFEMADCLFANHHGEDKRSPENEQALIGEMLSSLAQMAKDGNVPARGMEGLDQEVVAGITPAPAGRDLGDTSKEVELVNHLENASTIHHVACEGVVACDLQKEDKPKFTLYGQDNVGPFLVNANLNSNSAPCVIPLSFNNDECMRDRVLDAHPPEASPEKLPSPARAWKAARALFPHGGRRSRREQQPRTIPGRPSQSRWMPTRSNLWGQPVVMKEGACWRQGSPNANKGGCPKADSWAGISTSIEHPNKDKVGANHEKDKEGTRVVVSSAPMEVIRSQPNVDEDGFQLVSRKRKGKVHEGEMHIKSQHIENWQLKENVATVTFGTGNTGAIEPSSDSMTVSCELPNREMEGFIEDLDPGGCAPCGGIPIVGLN